MKKWFGIALTVGVLAVAAVLAAGSPPQAEPPTDQELVEEVRKLNGTLERMGILLEDFLDRQRVDMLMKRIEIKSRRLAPMEEELRQVRTRRESLQEEVKMIRMELERFEGDAEDPDNPDREASKELARQMRAQLEPRAEMVQDSIGDLDLRIVEMETAILSRRDEIQAWEELVDKELGIR